MGIYSRFIRPGRIGEMSAIGFVLLMAALFFGQTGSREPDACAAVHLKGETLALILIGYGFMPRCCRYGCCWRRATISRPFSRSARSSLWPSASSSSCRTCRCRQSPGSSTEPARCWSGSLFPFLFITIACGAVSGFHALISSGTTPKMLENEIQARFIGYGAMLMECFVAIMALIAATVLEPGVYFAMNSPPAVIGTTPRSRRARSPSWGFVVTPDTLTQLGTGCRREHGAVAYRRCTDAGGRHGAHPVGRDRRQGADGILVSLRHPVRGAVHPHHGRRGHARRPLHDSGSARSVVVPLRQDASPGPQQSIANGACGRRLGLFPLSGSHRSARRHQHTVAAVRHRQPDAGGDRADPGTVVLFKMKRERYAWVTIMPAVWLLICTLTAGFRRSSAPIQGSASLPMRVSSATLLAAGQGCRARQDAGRDAARDQQRLYRRNACGAVRGRCHRNSDFRGDRSYSRARHPIDHIYGSWRSRSAARSRPWLTKTSSLGSWLFARRVSWSVSPTMGRIWNIAAPGIWRARHDL